MNLPHDLEAERSTLGGVLFDGDALQKVREILATEDFHLPANGKVYDAMCALADCGELTDKAALHEHLTKAGHLQAAGGLNYLEALDCASTGTVSQTLRAAKVVRDRSRRRAAVVALRAHLNALQGDAGATDDLFEACGRDILAVVQPQTSGGLRHVSDVFGDADRAITANGERPGGFLGIPCGLDGIDRMLLGFQRKKFYVLAGRPGSGKTAFMCQIAGALSFEGPVAVFSQEMVDESLIIRLGSGAISVDSQRLEMGRLDATEQRQWQRFGASLKHTQLFIDDTPRRTLGQVAAGARRLKQKFGKLAGVFVDYLQIMEPSKAENRNLEVAHDAIGLAALAKELDTSVVALAQLSREVERRQDKRPMLSDLRDSGAVEAAADVVMFTHREFFYSGKEQDRDKAEFIVAKHRGGRVGSIEMRFIDQFTRFENAF